MFWEKDPVSVIMDKVEYALEHQTDLMHRIANEVSANKAVLDQTLADLITYFKDK